MEGVVIILLIVILVILIKLKNSFDEKIHILQNEIVQLNQTLSATLVKKPVSEQIPVVEKKEAPAKPTPESYWETNFKIADEQDDIKIQEQLENWQPVEQIASNTPRPVVEKEAATIGINRPPIRPAEPVKPSFFERNPDLEKFIGENLVSKIGIGILVLAIGYFVKFAIDNNWIGEWGRVAIGIACGVILVGIAHYTRKNYKAFSTVLAGGGLAVFYFTIALAYHQFHLFGQTTAFLIMVAITVLAISLSLFYDSQQLAIIALVGGFAAPFMVSNGSGNYKTLFIYLILLNTGLLVLAYKKSWRLMNLLAFLFTVILFSGWLFSLPGNESLNTYRNGFGFATVFYLLFFAINLAHNIRENKKFIASDFGIILANTSLFFIAGLFMIYQMEVIQYRGLFSAAMGVFNMGASYLLFRNRKVDINILYLLIGITLTFVSLTAPLQLEGNFITLFWASEAVLLYWLFQKSAIPIIRVTSIIIGLCMLFSLLLDWINIYRDSSVQLRIVLNKGFITSLYAAAAAFALFLLRRSDKDEPAGKSPLWLPDSVALQSSAVILLFIGGALEVNQQFKFHYPLSNINQLYLELYVFTFVLLVHFTRLARPRFYVEVALFSISILIYMVMIGQNFDLQANALTLRQNPQLFTIGHGMMAFAAAIIMFRYVTIVRFQNSRPQYFTDLFTWAICVVVIAFISVELNLLVRLFFYDQNNPLSELQRIYVKTVLPIVWGVCSFVLMWLGMKFSFKQLRIISLSLFTLTLAKLFLFDLRNIPVAGKIAAFFCLGVLLLVVSFMYQRLKKIITEDEQKASP